MKRLSESIWGDIRKRADGIDQRKEDKGNIDDIKPIDAGGSVLWADRDFEIGGEYLFSMKEVEEFLKNAKGWRLPTKKEAEELGDIYGKFGAEKYFDYLSLKFNKGKELIFQRRGRIFLSTGNSKIQNIRAYYCWTSTPIPFPQPDKSYNFRGLYLTDYEFGVNLTINRMDKVCLRLVKDKNMNESVWGDVRRRAEGTSVRKEDKTNMSEMNPIDMGLSVLWADRDLEQGGNSYFTADEVIEITKDSEWRLPTNEEMKELRKLRNMKHYQSFYTLPNFVFTFNNKKLEFENGKGYYYGNGTMAPSIGTYWFWSSTLTQDEEYYYAGCLEATHNKSNPGPFLTGFPADRDSRMAARLVKNK